MAKAPQFKRTGPGAQVPSAKPLSARERAERKKQAAKQARKKNRGGKKR